VTPNSNFKDLLSILNGCDVKYLIVGGYAVMLYSEPRFTKDLDVWIEASPDNASRVYGALAAFGAPLASVSAGEFAAPDLIYQLGVPPVRIDILTSITGVAFADAWPRRKDADFDGVPAHFIAIEDLLTNKRATGRTSDLLDCERLEEASRDS
jgi:Nucleotidyl transferase of unknown function (DUF2204)